MTINDNKKRIKLYIRSNITFEIKIIKKLYQLYYIIYFQIFIFDAQIAKNILKQLINFNVFIIIIIKLNTNIEN